jgi:hypothetical protein
MLVFWFVLILTRHPFLPNEQYFSARLGPRPLPKRRLLARCSVATGGGYKEEYNRVNITSWGSTSSHIFYNRSCVRAYVNVVDSLFADLRSLDSGSEVVLSGGAFYLDADSSIPFTANFSRSNFRNCSVVHRGGAIYALHARLIFITDCYFHSCKVFPSQNSNDFYGSGCVFYDCTNVIVQYTYFVNNTDYSQAGATFDCTECSYIYMNGISFLNNSFPNAKLTHWGPSAELQLEAWKPDDSEFKLGSLCFVRQFPGSTDGSLFYIVGRSPKNPGDAFTVWTINNVYFDHNQANPIKTDARYIVHSTNIYMSKWNDGCAIRPTIAFSPSSKSSPSQTLSKSGIFTESPLLPALSLHSENESIAFDTTVALRQSNNITERTDLIQLSLNAFGTEIFLYSRTLPTPPGTPEPQKQEAGKNLTGLYVGLSCVVVLLVIAAVVITIALRRVMRTPAFRKPDDDWSVGTWEIE